MADRHVDLPAVGDSVARLDLIVGFYTELEDPGPVEVYPS